MSQAADLNSSTPMSTRSHFAMRMEGLAIAALYILCFGWMHLQASAEFMSVRILTMFFVGLIAVPLVTGLPIVFVRRAMMGAVQSKPSVAAYTTFTTGALYALQGLLVFVITREGYNWAVINFPAL